MNPQPRKLRPDLTPAEREQAERIGSLDYKSHRRVDMRVLPFFPDKDHR